MLNEYKKFNIQEIRYVLGCDSMHISVIISE